MKRLLVSVFWPAWEWIRWPERKWLYSSYAATLSIREPAAPIGREETSSYTIDYNWFAQEAAVLKREGSSSYKIDYKSVFSM